MMPLWGARLNQDRCSSYDMKDPREGEQVYSFILRQVHKIIFSLHEIHALVVSHICHYSYGFISFSFSLLHSTV